MCAIRTSLRQYQLLILLFYSCAFCSFITATFMFEAMAAGNALLRLKEKGKVDVRLFSFCSYLIYLLQSVIYNRISYYNQL